ncbi:MAG: DUF1080 domain-containing protein [Balneolaceae bacterium]
MASPINRFSPLIFLLFLLYTQCAPLNAQSPEDTEVWQPVPPVTDPAGPHFTPPPADAIVLFDGTSADEWVSARNGEPAEWILEDRVLTVQPGSGDIETKRSFGDIQLHLEFRAPAEISGQGQGRGNSGIFLQQRYEIQVLDNWENPTYVNGMTGSIYKQHIPLANPGRKPGEWQSYDIFYSAPRFDEQDRLIKPARVTVLLNGILIQNNVEIFGNTVYIGEPSYEAHGPLPIRLQDHGNLVSYRNVWLREAERLVSESTAR